MPSSGGGIPRVSIGMPVFNGERFVEAAVRSILAQTMGDFELIISDNASTDDTGRICEELAAGDDRIRYLRQPTNVGPLRNFNLVFEAGRAPLFRWAAHDDLLLPTYLERCVAALEGDPDAVLSHSRTVLIDAQGDLLSCDDDGCVTADGVPYRPPEPPFHVRGLDAARPSRRFRGIVIGTFWCFEIFGVIRREAIVRTGLFEDFYGTDKIVLADLALQGPFVEVDQPLFQRRCHPTTSTNLSHRGRTAWSGNRGYHRPAIARLATGYLMRPFQRGLSPLEVARCVRVALEKILGPGRIRRLVIPGPDNYLGIGSR